MSSKLGLVIVSAGLAFSACAPKDEKLGANAGGAGTATVMLNSSESIKLVFVGFDRQAEALHLLKAAISPDYATQKNIVSAEVVSSVKTLSVPAGYGDKGDVVSDNLQALVQLDTDSTIKSVLIQDQLPKAAGNKKVDNNSSLKTLSKQISVTKKEAGIYDVAITVIEETNSRANGNRSSTSFATFSIAWDGKAETLNNPISVTRIYGMGHNKYGGNSFTVKSIESTLTFKLAAECVKIDGAVSLVSSREPKKGQTNEVYSLSLSDSSIVVAGKSVGYTAAACASRPVVDLSKLF